MHPLPPETERVIAEVVARFVRRFPTPPRYHPDEWRVECLGEAWRCVADAVRTYDPSQGKWTGYLARAVWQHLRDYRQREWAWGHRACVALETAEADTEGCEVAWVDPASVGLEQAVCARVALEQALAGLSEADRQLVEWVWVEGMSQVEAAGRFGVSQPAVAKRLGRVKAWLQRELGQTG